LHSASHIFRTFVEVTRKLSVSSSEDRPFVPGEMQVIIAVGASDSLVYHGSTRHATVVKFFGPTIDSTVTEKDTQLVSLRMNSVIPNQFTTYNCQSFALPAVADGSIVRVTFTCVFTFSSLTLLLILESLVVWPTTC
jgi:hypothetical protein